MQAVIFDLDNCLSAPAEAGADLLDSTFAAIRTANDGSVTDDVLVLAFANMWRHAYDWVARKYRFTPAMWDAGWRQLSQLEVTGSMHGYGDLHLLSEVPAECFLVTSGFPGLQQSKIRALHIADRFAEILVHAIDDPQRSGKRRLFQDIIARHHFDAAQVLVVGDNPDSELAAASSLGLRSIQMLRPGVGRSDVTTYHVADLRELIELMQSSLTKAGG